MRFMYILIADVGLISKIAMWLWLDWINDQTSKNLKTLLFFIEEILVSLRSNFCKVSVRIIPRGVPHTGHLSMQIDKYKNFVEIRRYSEAKTEKNSHLSS